jgi:hypothetical protein
MTLKESLLAETQRPLVLTDCEKVIDEEVASKSGLGGIAVKAAFGMVKAVKPGIIRESVNALLDEFVEKMEPFYADFTSKGTGTFESYFTARSSEVADALLGVTDARARKSSHGTLKKAYETLRPKGKQHVEAALPRLARMVSKHTK